MKWIIAVDPFPPTSVRCEPLGAGCREIFGPLPLLRKIILFLSLSPLSPLVDIDAPVKSHPPHRASFGLSFPLSSFFSSATHKNLNARGIFLDDFDGVPLLPARISAAFPSRLFGIGRRCFFPRAANHFPPCSIQARLVLISSTGQRAALVFSPPFYNDPQKPSPRSGKKENYTSV